MKAAERIAYYATQFSMVDIETTYRFPPTPALAQQWVDRTPPGFRYDIEAWSLLTGAPTMPDSLFEDLVGEVRPDRRDNRRLYPAHLSADAVEECWLRFRHALQPLLATDRLGTVIFRYPRWFGPGDTNRETLAQLRYRMGEIPVAVQFSNVEWVRSEFCETTFEHLEDLDLSFVCVDAGDDDPRGLDGIAATTNDVGVVRLLGRRERTEDDSWGPDWRGYRYDDDEIAHMSKRITYLADCCRDLHVIVATTWRDDAVYNAGRLQEAASIIDLR